MRENGKSPDGNGHGLSGFFCCPSAHFMPVAHLAPFDKINHFFGDIGRMVSDALQVAGHEDKGKRAFNEIMVRRFLARVSAP